MRPRPSRRTVLRAAAALPLVLPTTACTAERSPAPPPPVPVDPDVALRAAAVRREQALLAAYDAALAGDPRLAARLTPLRAEHVVHLQALEAPVASPSPSPSPFPSASAARAPARPRLGDLAEAERSAAAAHAAAVPLASRGLAAVLATLAASEASHPGALA